MGALKILYLDIETAPLLAWVWKLWDNNVAVNQIHTDWHLMSWCAKWADSPELLYMDQRNEPDIQDDHRILNGIWALLDEAEVIITQNGKKFDEKKLNARFIINDFKPPSPYKHIDTRQIAKKHFGFTSTSLEYLSDKLCETKKLRHEKYPGFLLWKECLARNPEAWDDMEKYNKIDVVALEELHKRLRPWDSTFNPNLHTEGTSHTCTCGGTMFYKNGYHVTSTGKYNRIICKNCGAPYRERDNQFDAMKRLTLKIPIPR